MRRKLVIGNWKMNGNCAGNAVLLSEIVAGLGEKGADCAVCAPAPYLAQCRRELTGTPVAWGGQDVSSKQNGAYTGEVAACMLAEFGCRYVLVGHSERRAYHLESNELVAQKALAALSSGLTPVVCVGEPERQRAGGRGVAVVTAHWARCCRRWPRETWRRSSCRTSLSGPSAPARRPRRSRRRMCTRSCVRNWRKRMRRRRPACGFCTVAA